jgi:aminoglycoside 6'-N-acetyltransferase I
MKKQHFNIVIRRMRKTDIPRWLEMRWALWPECPLREHRREIAEFFNDTKDQPVWMAEAANAELAGFLEVSVRNYAEGAGRKSVGYLEGWYVKPGFRKHGIGHALVKAAEYWATRRGFTHMASDTELDNEISLKSHLAMGYREVERGIHFVKRLKNRKRL